ncbi:MAG: sigma-70 family RNA polymerase sigma factor [Tannerella sp.]|jgi:RNA polymerase sigma-70 factor (ECF subfamily)|nr:sigma-70 family RNA polymerase sigma factor [Tannerella sp.]
MELETFKKTVVPLREKLLVYTHKLAGNQVEAEDLVQEVFLKLWSIRDKLDEYQSVEALAFKVTKNKVLDELKRPGNEYLDLENINRPDTATNPDKLIEQKEAAAFIKQFIKALPTLQQTIIHMKDVEGYELSEISQITGTQIEAVRVNLSRARKKIREQLIRLNSINGK